MGTTQSTTTLPGSELSRPYWEAASAGRLVLQRCTGCGTVRHYPRLLCERCHSDQVEWIEASRRGAVHSWTVAHHAFLAALAADVPYVLLTVDLDEGVRAMGRFEGTAALRIGLPVAAEFRNNADGVPVLVFSTPG